MVFCPLRVEELAELLAFDFEARSIPKFHEDWRLEDPIRAVLSTCRSFLAVVDDQFYSDRKYVQFSHFSVEEFLTSPAFLKQTTLFSAVIIFPRHLLIPSRHEHV